MINTKKFLVKYAVGGLLLSQAICLSPIMVEHAYALTQVCPPGPDSRAVCPPGPDSRVVCPPGPDSRAVCPPGPDSRAVCPPGPDSKVICPPGPNFKSPINRVGAK